MILKAVLRDAAMLALRTRSRDDGFDDLSSVLPRLQQVSMWQWFAQTDYWTAFALARETGLGMDEIITMARSGLAMQREDIEMEIEDAIAREQRDHAAALFEQTGVVVMRRLGRQMLESFWCHVRQWPWATPPGRARFSVIEDMREALHDVYRDERAKIFLVQFAGFRYLSRQSPPSPQPAGAALA